MSRLVADSPHPVVRRGWRRGVPLGVLHLAAMAVVHAMLLPDVDRSGEAGEHALQRWLLASLATAAVTTVAWLALCVRIDLGGNRWVPPSRRSGVPPAPDPATGCLPVVVAVLTLSLGTLLEVVAVAGRDAVLLTAVILLVQLAGVVLTVFVVLSLLTPAVLVVTGLARCGPATGGGGATGPSLVASGIASYAALALVALPLAVLLLDLPVPGRALSVVAAGLATVLVVALAYRLLHVRRARPA